MTSLVAYILLALLASYLSIEFAIGLRLNYPLFWMVYVVTLLSLSLLLFSTVQIWRISATPSPVTTTTSPPR